MSKKYQEGMNIIEYIKKNVNLENLDLNQILEVKYITSFNSRFKKAGIDTSMLKNCEVIKITLEKYLSIFEKGGLVKCIYKCDYCGKMHSQQTTGFISSLKRSPKMVCDKQECIRKKAIDGKCLNGKSIGDKYPELIPYWSDKNDKSIYEYSYGSKKEVWWKCDKGCPDYKMIIKDKLKCGCPYCSNKRVWEGNCLDTKYPEIAKDFYQERNGNITPYNVVYGSTEKVWWKCSICGHEWKSIIVDRTTRGHGCDKCFRKSISKENNYRWRHDLTEEDRERIRNNTENEYFRKSVYERDNYTCKICGDDKGGNLNAHHLNGWNWCKEERLDLDNAVTLCECCHKKFHKIYGYGNNTKEQFQEFLEKLNLENTSKELKLDFQIYT